MALSGGGGLGNGSEFVERKEGNQVLHVRGDSDSLMNSLFDSVLKKQESTMPLQVPLSMRKLPKSFFNPPSHGSKSPSISHSRTSSTDSSHGGGGPAPPLQASHMRAHSSPATLQQTYAAAQQQQQQQQNVHIKQQSYDFAGDAALPPGWEQACTAQGQTYYINHVEKTTTWEDPRKKMQPQSLFHPAQPSPQPQPVASVAQVPSVLSSTSQQQQLQQQLQQLSVAAGGGAPAAVAGPAVVGAGGLGPLPEGWAQAETDDGEMYFINHLTRTTSWFDPRLPERLQRPAALLQQNSGQPPGCGSPQQQSLQQRHQSLRVQQLKLESERLRICKRQVMKQWVQDGSSCADDDSQQSQQQQSSASQQQQPSAVQQLQQQLPRAVESSVSMRRDPSAGAKSAALESFLSSNSLDCHARQESADSGVGLNGNYSLPHTPEHILSPMDDHMDQTDDGVLGTLTGTEGVPAAAAALMETPDLPGLDNMDSDDLVASIQQLDGDGLMSDEMLLNDVTSIINANRMDNSHTWL